MAILNINNSKEVKSRLFEMMNKVNKISLNEDYNQQVENTRDRREIQEEQPIPSQKAEKRIDDDKDLHKIADDLDAADMYFQKMTDEYPNDKRVEQMAKMLYATNKYMYNNFFKDITVDEMYPPEAKNEPDTTNIYEDHESFHESKDMPSSQGDNTKDKSNPYLIFSRRTQDPKNVTHRPTFDNLRVKDNEIDSINELHTKELGDDDLKNAEKELETGDYENNGGVGDNTDIEKLNINQLIRGLNVEMEHTNDPAEALSIAVDHLTENPEYYGVGNENPQEMAQKEAEEDAEKEVKKSPEDEELDEILGYKPQNVKDYSHGGINEEFDYTLAKLNFQDKPDALNKIKRFEQLYKNWKQTSGDEKDEALNIYNELKLARFNSDC